MHMQKSVPYPIRLFSRDPRHRLLLGVSFTILVLSSIVPLWQISTGKTFYFLHYTILFGADKVGSYAGMFIPVFFGWISLCLNAVCGWYLSRFRPLYGVILSSTALFVSVAVGIQMYMMIFLNI